MGYQLYRPFVVDSGAFERTFGVRATPLQEALTATIDWYRARALEGRPSPGVAFAKGLAVLAFDNLLIGAAALAVHLIVRAVPSLSAISLGMAVAAGLYWLPPLRRALFALVRRPRRRPKMQQFARVLAGGVVVPCPTPSFSPSTSRWISTGSSNW